MTLDLQIISIGIFLKRLIWRTHLKLHEHSFARLHLEPNALFWMVSSVYSFGMVIGLDQKAMSLLQAVPNIGALLNNAGMVSQCQSTSTWCYDNNTYALLSYTYKRKELKYINEHQ